MRADLLHRLAPAALAVLLLAATGSARPAVDDDEAKAPEGAVEVPFRMLPTNHMLVQVMLNGEGPYRLIFDLGSPVTLINNAAALEAGVVEGAAFPMLFGARGEAEVDELTVGGLTAEAVPVMVMDHPVVRALGQMLGRPIHGLVGHTFFARYRTTIDYQAKTMTFEPVEAEIRDFLTGLPERMVGPKVARRIILEPSALLGLTLEDTEADASDGVTVARVLPDSPAAEAGIEAGDVLTTLDGRWTTSVADAYAAAMTLEPGAAVELIVRRGDDEQTLTITPRPGI